MRKTIIATLSLLFTLSVLSISALTFDDVQEARQKAEEHVKRDGYSISAQCIPVVYTENIDIKTASFKQLMADADSFHFDILKDDSLSGGISVTKRQNGFYAVDSSRFDGISPVAALNGSHTFDEAVILNDQGDYYYLLKTAKDVQVIPANIWRTEVDLRFTDSCSLTEFLNAVAYRNQYYPLKPQHALGSVTEIAYNYIGLTEQQQTKTTVMWVLSGACILAAVVGIGLIGMRIIRR